VSPIPAVDRPAILDGSLRRDASLICVVEEPGDVIPVERTHEYRGRYHVLGGALSPIDGVEPDDLKLRELVDRVRGGWCDLVDSLSAGPRESP